MSQRRITLKVGLLMEWQGTVGTVHSYFLMIQNILGEGRGERTVQASYSQEMETAGKNICTEGLNKGKTPSSISRSVLLVC